jgi:hypothetical protein
MLCCVSGCVAVVFVSGARVQSFIAYFAPLYCIDMKKLANHTVETPPLPLRLLYVWCDCKFSCAPPTQSVSRTNE